MSIHAYKYIAQNEVVQEAVQLESEEVEAEYGVVEVQGKEHFLDKRTASSFVSSSSNKDTR